MAELASLNFTRGSVSSRRKGAWVKDDEGSRQLVAMTRVSDFFRALFTGPKPEEENTSEQRQITIEYPLNPSPRYGYGRPPHRRIWSILNSRRADYERALQGASAYRSLLKEIARESPDPSQPSWSNDYFYGVDAIALYYFLSSQKPRRYIEIGSGNSTLFARRAVSDSRSMTEVVSIDPSPRVEVGDVCDIVVRERLEEADLSIFESLRPGDLVFVDGSHVCFTNTDVTVFFLEILPNLPEGVLVQLHDIYLPYDYPPEWKGRFYSEQYLLACYLLSGSDSIEPLLANAFVWGDNELHAIIEPLILELGYTGWHRFGTSFWFRWRGLDNKSE
jgi:hypothetical protein